MLTYRAGQIVGKGTYWDLSGGQRVDVLGEEGLLPGSANAAYIRLSPGLMLLVGPVMGLVYALLMPLLGIAAVATLGSVRLVSGAYATAVKSVSFGWRPGNAYLSGRKGKDEEDGRIGRCRPEGRSGSH